MPSENALVTWDVGFYCFSNFRIILSDVIIPSQEAHLETSYHEIENNSRHLPKKWAIIFYIEFIIFFNIEDKNLENLLPVSSSNVC